MKQTEVLREYCALKKIEYYSVNLRSDKIDREWKKIEVDKKCPVCYIFFFFSKHAIILFDLFPDTVNPKLTAVQCIYSHADATRQPAHGLHSGRVRCDT